jgi:hypothetical protein
MNDKRIYRDEFNNIIKELFPFSDKERDYLKAIFDKDLVDGLTEWELKDKVIKMQTNQTDEVDTYEAQKIKNKLLGKLGG